ncbi:transposase family protein [Leptolyngbyaceae cyanobacterium CCMR0081]|uniref:Transposase family protein n=1 Tax=Adonisia turfae CCMR0081 TaxID=2292702 RepID=A0A6M0RYQ6_9CYAN|nr:transposase family protein [Adonisia turfae CCMR0081]
MGISRGILLSSCPMPAPVENSVTLLEHCRALEDPRVEYLVEHRLLDIIGLTICAVICGMDR